MTPHQETPCLICSRSLVLCDAAREPRQVRKEAAVSGHPQVPQGNLRRLQARHGDFLNVEQLREGHDMAHLALYREWRPKTFDEIVEQKQAVHALRQSVVSGQIAHAYLFSGTRGTGKTTMAKIFSRAINCLNPSQGNPCNQCDICRAALDGSLMDIIEMDAASNNSVDNIRRICDEIVFMPSQARYKVYIIDEVHMLSAGAFNALLKTLEEPPSHAVFILATTEAHRIPATILSRCQRYEFRRIPVESMVDRLGEIARSDAIDITAEALRTVAALADGALRDAISILDQARSAFPPPITHDHVLSLVGVVRDQFLQQVASALIFGQIAALLQLIDQLVMAGRDLARFVTDLAQHLRNLLVCQVGADDSLLVRVNSEALADMRQLSGQVSSQRLIVLIRGLSALLSDLRWASDGRTALEVGMIRLMEEALPAAASVPAAVSAARPHDPAYLAAVRTAGTEPAGKAPAASAAQPAREAAQPQQDPAAPKFAATPVKKNLPDPPLPEPPTEDSAWTDATDPDWMQPAEVPQIQEAKPSKAAAIVPEGKNNESGPVAAVSTVDEQPNSPETMPAADPEPESGATPEADVAVGIPIDEYWKNVLASLQDSGQMTLYLFSRPAQPVLCQDTLQLVFSAGDTVHYHEVNQPSALKTLRETLRRCSGKDWPIQPVMASSDEQAACRKPAADNWVERIQQTAQSLGIPVKMEE